METGFRERQGISPRYNRIMRFEPRPGFFQADPYDQPGRSPAISNDPRTWPDLWPDRMADPDDPGWPGSWDGYFGKRAAADQESYTVMDDDFYDAWDYPIAATPRRDGPTRASGSGLRVEVRGFQWANPQAGNVIFWHYDITNEGTTDYDDNIIFGLYMDSGVGGSALSCDGIYESDDDNAYFDRSSGLNLVYTWDTYGHGVDLSGNCGPTGYLGYAYMETPGQPLRRDRQRPGRDHRREPRQRARREDRRAGGHPGLRVRALRHGEVPDVLRSAREPPGLPRRRLVDGRRGHGLDGRVRCRAGHDINTTRVIGLLGSLHDAGHFPELSAHFHDNAASCFTDRFH